LPVTVAWRTDAQWACREAIPNRYTGSNRSSALAVIRTLGAQACTKLATPRRRRQLRSVPLDLGVGEGCREQAQPLRTLRRAVEVVDVDDVDADELAVEDDVEHGGQLGVEELHAQRHGRLFAPG